MTINAKIIDELLIDYEKPEDLLGENGILKQLTKSLLERALEAEMDDHLGYEKNVKGKTNGNCRNGHSEKTIQSDSGTFPIKVPRDRISEFDPKIVPKRQKRLKGFDDKIISLYARGLSTREIESHLEEI